MANGETITVTGNLGGDPELRFTPTGQAVASFSVGSTPRYLDKTTNEWKDGDTNWFRCNAWRDLAENVAASLQRGMRVIVTGRLKIRKYEKDGVERTSVEIEVDEVGPSLKNATAKVEKVSRQGGGGNARDAQQGAPIPPDPWASGGYQAPSGGARDAFAGASEEPPF